MVRLKRRTISTPDKPSGQISLTLMEIQVGKRKPLSYRASQLREIYRQLSAPPEATVIAIDEKTEKRTGNSTRELGNKISYVRRLVSVGGKAVPEKKAKVATTCKLKPATWKDAEGNVQPIEHVEVTQGDIYSPRTRNSKFDRVYDYEWALTFKIDCDRAREQGMLDEILELYANSKPLLPFLRGDCDMTEEEGLAIERQVAEKVKKDKKKKRRKSKGKNGRPPKSNYVDLRERYRKDPEARAWIKQNKEELEATDKPDSKMPKDFYHEKYVPQVLDGAVEYRDDWNLNDYSRDGSKKSVTSYRDPDKQNKTSTYRRNADASFGSELRTGRWSGKHWKQD